MTQYSVLFLILFLHLASLVYLPFSKENLNNSGPTALKRSEYTDDSFLGCSHQTFCEDPAGFPNSDYLQNLMVRISPAEKLVLQSNNIPVNEEIEKSMFDLGISLKHRWQKFAVHIAFHNPIHRCYVPRSWRGGGVHRRGELRHAPRRPQHRQPVEVHR